MHTPRVLRSSIFTCALTIPLFGATAPTFAPAINTPANSSFRKLATADFNGDGKLDVAGINFSGALAILLGNGDGSFQQPHPPASANSTIPFPISFTVGDVNQDGIPDLVVIGSSRSFKSQIQVLLGKGDGSFVPTAINALGTCGSERELQIADYNGDGIPDLIAGIDLSGCQGLNFTPGLGKGAFGNTQAVALGFAPFDRGDFNGDGLLDLAAAPQGLLLGTGAGHFQFSPTDFAPVTSTFTPFSVNAIDINGDGKLDVAVTSETFIESGKRAFLFVSLGNGDGTFQAPLTTVLTSEYLGTASADFNRDGCADIVFLPGGVGNPSDVDLALGNPDGSVTLSSLAVHRAYTIVGLAVGDFNGDGKPDIVFSREGLTTLLNTTP